MHQNKTSAPNSEQPSLWPNICKGLHATVLPLVFLYKSNLASSTKERKKKNNKGETSENPFPTSSIFNLQARLDLVWTSFFNLSVACSAPPKHHPENLTASSLPQPSISNFVYTGKETSKDTLPFTISLPQPVDVP